MVAIRDRVSGEMVGNVPNLEMIRRIAFERTLEKVGSSDKKLAKALHVFYMQQRFKMITLYDDVLPMFEALSSRFKIGLLSKGAGVSSVWLNRNAVENDFEIQSLAELPGVLKSLHSF